ncbi:trehalose utilization protein ThuA [Planctomonas sp. JC2975]|uniref:ThuA domain-containing protein n=1 Tax=Planctomonas sp. JC2975 TaxID=2729626 RepID=UPI001474F1A0|nr:ThuA domain-containing protein [Planctomonas sp. JC2975]NNC13498.1 trehalose utilization protein ThuA [Planctomonas sp. JC2975]
MRITVWNENFHETHQSDITAIYPNGIHGAIAEGLASRLPEADIRTATLDQPHHGLDAETLDATDVLLWWGHMKHDEVSDEVVERVHERVLAGMGLIVLHSGHFSKIFKRLMGTTCSLKWRNEAERELVWTVNPTHPIAEGIPSPLVIGQQEMYGEFFDVPTPDELVFVSSFSGGEVFRSGMTYRRGHGKVFYFSPGDQEYPVFYHDDVRAVLANAVRWAAPVRGYGRIPEVSNPGRDWFAESSSAESEAALATASAQASGAEGARA